MSYGPGPTGPVAGTAVAVHPATPCGALPYGFHNGCSRFAHSLLTDPVRNP